MSRDIVSGLKFRRKSGLDGPAIARTIEAGYLAKARESKFTTKKTFAPSSIGYGHATCARYWYQAFSGAFFEENVDAMGLANMAYGSQAHERIQKIMADQGILEAAEVEITLSDPPVRGYLDALINWEGETIVAEIKTTRQESFVFKQVSGKPSPNHLLQILLYLKATGCKRGFLLYENKNDQSFLVIPVEFDEKNQAILEDALVWMRKVYKTWQDKIVPNRPFRPKYDENNKVILGQVCGNCPIRKACWEDTNAGEVKITRMAVPTL